MANSKLQNETKEVTLYTFDKDDQSGLSLPAILLNESEVIGNFSTHLKMTKIGPSEPYNTFYKDYHNYIVVIFIAVVILIIICSIIYVAMKRRKYKRMLQCRKGRRKSSINPLSRRFSQSSLVSNYESISSRRRNNKHARLTSQRSWADSPLSGMDKPFYDEILNKSLPTSTEAGSLSITPISAYKRQQEFSSGAISSDTNSSSAELAKFYRQHGAFSPCYDISSESTSPEPMSESRHHRIPLSELKSGSGIVVQISNMDLISTAVPRSPFAEKRKFKSLVFSTSLPESGSEGIPQTSPLDSPSSELNSISEECQDGKH